MTVSMSVAIVSMRSLVNCNLSYMGSSLDIRAKSFAFSVRIFSLNARNLLARVFSTSLRSVSGSNARVKLAFYVLNGKPIARGTYRQSIDNGIVYLSEDRKGDGVFLDLSIASNVSALNLRQVSTAWGTVDRGREAEQANRLGDKLALKRGGIDHPVSSLSGGNQQKVAIAKMLSVNPRVIFLDEPTRGVDVGAKSEIHRILRDLAKSGVGIVVVSSELPELIGLCDRVLVVREGLINGEVEGDTLTEENIMRLASFTERASRPEVLN